MYAAALPVEGAAAAVSASSRPPWSSWRQSFGDAGAAVSAGASAAARVPAAGASSAAERYTCCCGAVGSWAACMPGVSCAEDAQYASWGKSVVAADHCGVQFLSVHHTVKGGPPEFHHVASTTTSIRTATIMPTVKKEQWGTRSRTYAGLGCRHRCIGSCIGFRQAAEEAPGGCLSWATEEALLWSLCRSRRQAAEVAIFRSLLSCACIVGTRPAVRSPARLWSCLLIAPVIGGADTACGILCSRGDTLPSIPYTPHPCSSTSIREVAPMAA